MSKQFVTVDIWNGRPIGYISSSEFAKQCGVLEVTVRAWIHRNKLDRALKIGNDWWIALGTQKPERKKRDKRSGRQTLFFVEEIAEILEINPETVRRWIRSGHLKTNELWSKKAGYRINRRDLDEFMLTRASKKISDKWFSKGL